MRGIVAAVTKTNIVPTLIQGLNKHENRGYNWDALVALRLAKSLGQEQSLVICNLPESAVAHEFELRFNTRAGPEIGVASTKIFTTELEAIFIVTQSIASEKEVLVSSEETQYLHELRHLPRAVIEVLKLENSIKVLAEKFVGKQDSIFLEHGGRYLDTLEGSLKPKEISYIHVGVYPAWELKNGPLALIDSDMPVVAIMLNDKFLNKLKLDLQEVKARCDEFNGIHILHLPEYYGELLPALHLVASQLFVYHHALIKDDDVDRARNLTNSVTLE